MRETRAPASPPSRRRPKPERRPYAAPRLARWGSLREVTRKTGATLDLNQVMKMGLG